jgi:hypothetical protein
MEQGNPLHPQIPLDVEAAEFPNDPWPRRVDIRILRFMMTWAIESPFKSHQLQVNNKATSKQAWAELRRKDASLTAFEEMSISDYADPRMTVRVLPKTVHIVVRITTTKLCGHPAEIEMK